MTLSLLRRFIRVGRRAVAAVKPLQTHPGRTAIGANACVDPSARLTVLDAEQAPKICIALGDNVYLGRGVEITAAGGGAVLIGHDTSLQDGDIIYGDVRIGSHCLFGRQVFVASRGHAFRREPTWLIRDQDAAVLASLPNAGPRTVIEDDCWIAQNVVVMPGVYVGRGAVLGANCVVTKDVGPYEIHGGVPNRKIGTRVEFRPPNLLSATEDSHLPYFYRGFALSQAALTRSRTQGVIMAHGQPFKACLVLAGAEGGQLEIRGRLASGTMQLRVNGEMQPTNASGDFAIRAIVPPASDTRPAPLRDYTLVEFAAESAFSIATAFVS
jgi:acetyltransferase-like isoleucine patch superfamily enzyme